MQQGPIVLLHISDIHFNKSSNSTYDLDEDLRNQLENDLKELKAEVGDFTGIVVTGDISFSATTDQYTKAYEWLEKICKITDVRLNYVWMVPGNHDISWSEINSNKYLKLLHEELRGKTDDQIDSWVQSSQADTSAVEVLNKPLEEYNRFAVQFLCDSNFNKPFWEADLMLNDGSLLRIRGLNSVFVSTEQDTKEVQKYKLILPMKSCLPKEEDGITYLALCHHSLNWLRNEKEISNALNSRFKVQLFGHEHDHQVLPINNSLRIHAGAVHPERDQARTRAQYNVLKIDVDQSEAHGRRLRVKVYPRTYNQQTYKFVKANAFGSGSYEEHFVPLKPFTKPQAPAVVRTEGPAKPATSQQEAEMIQITLQQSLKLLMLNLSKLSFPKQIEIADSLGVFEKEDEFASATQRTKNFLARAQDRGLLFIFWEKVAAEHGITGPNPFEKIENKTKPESL